MYPCDCEDMKWMVDTNAKFKYEDGHWLDTWIELDKTDKGTNIENFGVKFNYCEFCGKRIKG
jgi:hypothetical protein